MVAVAKAKYIRISPYKVRRIANEIKNNLIGKKVEIAKKTINDSLDLITYSFNKYLLSTYFVPSTSIDPENKIEIMKVYGKGKGGSLLF